MAEYTDHPRLHSRLRMYFFGQHLRITAFKSGVLEAESRSVSRSTGSEKSDYRTEEGTENGVLQ